MNNDALGHFADPKKPRLSILIADDDVATLETLKFMLQGFGYNVVADVKTGREAVNLAHKLNPDLIILDIGLPDMDGLDAAVQILSNRSVPIIIGTGISREDVLERASALNIHSYLIKPFRSLQLQTSIRMAMIHHQQLKQHPAD